MPSSRPTRRHLTLQQKVLIIEKREREGLKQDELALWAAREFALPSVPTQPTISNILKDKDKLREALRLNPSRPVKSVRDVTCPQFEDAVVQWVLAQGARVDRRAILEHAAEQQARFPRAKDLALSEGWLTRLMERHGHALRAVEEEETARTGDSDHAVDATHASSLFRAADSLQDVLSASASASASSSPVYTNSPGLHRGEGHALAVLGSLAHEPSRSPLRSSGFCELHELATDTTPAGTTRVYDSVRDYYGRQLKSSNDLKTNAFTCSPTAPPRIVSDIMRCIPEEVMTRYFGCGLPIPLGIRGFNVLDLGCGSGRDAYILSALVGPSGSVVGVDMTPEQLLVAKRNVPQFTERLGNRPHADLRFLQGYMEDLESAGIASESVDLVVSNFALSLSPDKERVLQEICRVLRPGGEFMFSDVYAMRRLPDPVRETADLFNEGLGGALYVDDFKELSRHVGFGEPRQVDATPITIEDEELASMVGLTQFYSITYRCFKVSGLEMRPTEEDYGHVAKYLGTIPGHALAYDLDNHYHFEVRRPVRVGGNTAAILKNSWLASHFHVDGDWSEHFGRFDLRLAARSLSSSYASPDTSDESVSTQRTNVRATGARMFGV